MKKKDTLSQKDKEDWKNFLEDTSRVPDKDKKYQIKDTNSKFRFDLHGLTLNEANKKVKEIVKYCSEKNYKEILLITGKGLHSKIESVYSSKNFSKLGFSIPEFLKTDKEISRIYFQMQTETRKRTY